MGADPATAAMVMSGDALRAPAAPVGNTTARRRRGENVRNLYMRRDEHWWSVNDADFALIGGFNWWATSFFSLAAFFATWFIGFSFDLFMADVVTTHKSAVVGWLIYLCGLIALVFFVLGIANVLKKRSYIQSIKDKSSPM